MRAENAPGLISETSSDMFAPPSRMHTDDEGTSDVLRRPRSRSAIELLPECEDPLLSTSSHLSPKFGQVISPFAWETPKARWMYADVWNFTLARRDPLRWSKALRETELCLALESRPQKHRHRPVVVQIQGTNYR